MERMKNSKSNQKKKLTRVRSFTRKSERIANCVKTRVAIPAKEKKVIIINNETSLSPNQPLI
jgi:hypothetical protein